jgi:hypothetical protein
MDEATKFNLVESLVSRYCSEVTVAEAMRVYKESARFHFQRMADDDLATIVENQYPDLAELYGYGQKSE